MGTFGHEGGGWMNDDQRGGHHPEAKEIHETTSQDWKGPQTHDEARCFHQGVLAGLTMYAREKGDSTLKSENELLRRLMDEQGWATIETFEELASKPGPEERLNRIADVLAGIVVSEGEDAGVILLSADSPTRYDPEANCQVYIHEHFSPLGDALVHLAKMARWN